MARLLIGNSLRGVVERWPFIHRCIWALEAGLFGLFLLICRCLPLSAAQALGRAIMSRAGPRQNKHRHVLRNLSIAFPDYSETERAALSRELWGNVGKVFAEYAHLDRLSRRAASLIDVEGGEHLQALAREKRPALFVTAHLGNWEIAGCALRAAGIPISVVYTPLQNPYLDQLVRYCRRGHGSGLLTRDEGARAMLRELAAGRSVGIVMDQRVDAGVPVPLFGVDKSTTPIPARLALRQGVNLIPLRTERLAGGRFRLTVGPPIRPTDTTAPRQAQALQVTRQINALFEAWIRERPQDWFCTNRLWPKDARPAAPPAPLAEDSPRPA